MTVKRIIASLAAIFTLGVLPAVTVATTGSAAPVAAAPATFYHG